MFPQRAIPRLPRHVENGKVNVVFRELLNLETHGRRRFKRRCLRRQQKRETDTTKQLLSSGVIKDYMAAVRRLCIEFV